MSTTFFRPTEPALLGVDFRLRKIEIRRGSVEFWVYVAGGFTLIPHYANFVRSLELLVAQIQDLLRRLFEGLGLPDIVIQGGWTSTTASKPRSRIASFRISQELILLLVVLYLIANHAALLTVLLRIALKRTVANEIRRHRSISIISKKHHALGTSELDGYSRPVRKHLVLPRNNPEYKLLAPTGFLPRNGRQSIT